MDDIFGEFDAVPVKPVPKPAQTPPVRGFTTAVTKMTSNMAPAIKTTEHTHPATKDASYKIEKAYTTNSAGGAITEGCIDHYSDRIVVVEDVAEEEEISFLDEIAEDDISKYVIMGDVLNHPKFKKL